MPSGCIRSSACVFACWTAVKKCTTLRLARSSRFFIVIVGSNRSTAGSMAPIVSKEQLREATQDDCAEKNCKADQVPTIRTKRNHAHSVEKTAKRHHQKERTCDITVRPPAACGSDTFARTGSAVWHEPYTIGLLTVSAEAKTLAACTRSQP